MARSARPAPEFPLAQFEATFWRMPANGEPHLEGWPRLVDVEPFRRLPTTVQAVVLEAGFSVKKVLAEQVAHLWRRWYGIRLDHLTFEVLFKTFSELEAMAQEWRATQRWPVEAIQAIELRLFELEPMLVETMHVQEIKNALRYFLEGIRRADDHHRSNPRISPDRLIRSIINIGADLWHFSNPKRRHSPSPLSTEYVAPDGTHPRIDFAQAWAEEIVRRLPFHLEAGRDVRGTTGTALDRTPDLTPEDAKEWARDWIGPHSGDPTLIDAYDWRFEWFDPVASEGIRYASLELDPDPSKVFGRERWRQWLAGEYEITDRYHDIVEAWSPHDPEDIIVTFQPDAQGRPYMVIWEGHHRLAAASVRGDAPFRIVVGRWRGGDHPRWRQVTIKVTPTVGAGPDSGETPMLVEAEQLSYRGIEENGLIPGFVYVGEPDMLWFQEGPRTHAALLGERWYDWAIIKISSEGIGTATALGLPVVFVSWDDPWEPIGASPDDPDAVEVRIDLSRYSPPLQGDVWRDLQDRAAELGVDPVEVAPETWALYVRPGARLGIVMKGDDIFKLARYFVLASREEHRNPAYDYGSLAPGRGYGEYDVHMATGPWIFWIAPHDTGEGYSSGIQDFLDDSVERKAPDTSSWITSTTDIERDFEWLDAGPSGKPGDGRGTVSGRRPNLAPSKTPRLMGRTVGGGRIIAGTPGDWTPPQDEVLTRRGRPLGPGGLIRAGDEGGTLVHSEWLPGLAVAVPPGFELLGETSPAWDDPNLRLALQASGQEWVPRIRVYRYRPFYEALVAAGLIAEGSHSHPACEFVLIPGGTFRQGMPDKERLPHEPTQRMVSVEPFLLARTPVTKEVLAAFSSVPWRAPAYEDAPLVAARDLTWGEAETWCTDIGLRLPTESEWEHACRAGTATAFSFGDDDRLLEVYAFIRGTRQSKPSVATRLPNAFGLFDVHGNVWECVDTRVDRSEGRYGVVRGGSREDPPFWLRSAMRERVDVNRPYKVLGFRPAADLVGGGPKWGTVGSRARSARAFRPSLPPLLFHGTSRHSWASQPAAPADLYLASQPQIAPEYAFEQAARDEANGLLPEPIVVVFDGDALAGLVADGRAELHPDWGGYGVTEHTTWADTLRDFGSLVIRGAPDNFVRCVKEIKPASEDSDASVGGTVDEDGEMMGGTRCQVRVPPLAGRD